MALSCHEFLDTCLNTAILSPNPFDPRIAIQDGHPLSPRLTDDILDRLLDSSRFRWTSAIETLESLGAWSTHG